MHSLPNSQQPTMELALRPLMATHKVPCILNGQHKSQQTCHFGRSCLHRVVKDGESPDWATIHNKVSFTTMGGCLLGTLRIEREVQALKNLFFGKAIVTLVRKMESLLICRYPMVERALQPQTAAHKVPCASNGKCKPSNTYLSGRSCQALGTKKIE